MNNDVHLSQIARISVTAEEVDLPQQDFGHQVSGEAQVSSTNGWER